MLKGQKARNRIRCLVFLLVFCVLLYGVDGLLTHKWWYPMFSESPTYQYRELYDMDLSDLQAVFLGTSHMEFSVDPMQIYKDKGFVTYNLSSSSQPMEGSYYILEEIFRLTNPQYVFFDVSKLFTTSTDPYHRQLFDNFQWGLPKLKYIEKWAQLNEEKGMERLISAFFPIVEYHDRWESLTEQDFINEPGKRQYYRKGYYPRSSIASGQVVTVDRMNDLASQRYMVDIKNTVIKDGKTMVKDGKLTYMFKPTISASRQEMVLNMAQLCKEHNAKLVLVKIPSVYPPQKYSSAWTEIKSGIVKEFTEKAGIDYIDLFYDYDLGLDWKTDTCDNGVHLNYLGAKKATAFFEEYLEKAGLDRIKHAAYDKDLDIYEKVFRIIRLQTIQDFEVYFQTIQNMDNISIFISTRDDMQKCLSQKHRDIMKNLGIQSKMEELQYRGSFAALIDKGESVYEELSIGSIEHEGVLSDGTAYKINSAGFLDGDTSKIMINNSNYSCNSRGMNIVIYDHESGLVLDSCTFDTWATDQPKATRTLSGFSKLFHYFDEWCMQTEYEHQLH